MILKLSVGFGGAQVLDVICIEFGKSHSQNRKQRGAFNLFKYFTYLSSESSIDSSIDSSSDSSFH